MCPDSLHDIKSWLGKQETEDPIPTKSKDRVLRDVAMGIRKNKDLPKGACNLCMTETERLAPVLITICSNCARKIIKHGHNTRVLKREFGDYYCDKCLGRTFTKIQINPLVCQKCSLKIGKRHEYDLVDMRKQKAMNDAKKPFKIAEKEKIEEYKMPDKEKDYLKVKFKEKIRRKIRKGWRA